MIVQECLFNSILCDFNLEKTRDVSPLKTKFGKSCLGCLFVKFTRKLGILCIQLKFCKHV